MKNHLFKILLCASTFSLLSSGAVAATASGTANARVVTPIAVSAGTALEFGSFAAGATSGTITQAGAVTGGVVAISSGATRSSGTFTVTGEASANTAYTFSMADNGAAGANKVTLSSGANTMIATLTASPAVGTQTLISGTNTVTVTGSLAVAANQAAGAYTGTYTVTAVY